MKKLMILGASVLQLPAILKAKEMGLQVVAVDIDQYAIGFQEADVCLELSTLDIPGVIAAARKHMIDGIMTLASDMPMRTVAAVARELNIVGVSEETALRATHKALMRECLKAHNVPIPAFYTVNTYEAYMAALHYLTGKVIVKPVDNSGSRGVFLIENRFDEAVIDYAFDYSKSSSRSGDIIVEEYMDGSEVSVETLSVDGEVHILAITDKLTTGAPRFIEMGHSQPSCLNSTLIGQIKEVAIAAVNAIGIVNGPAHTEIIVTNDGPKIVELGARLGGDNISTHLVPLSTGVDMIKCCINLALGQKVTIPNALSAGSAIRYIVAPVGVVSSINGIEEAKDLFGVKHICLTKSIGDTIGEVMSSVDRAGYIIVQAENVAEALRICDQAIEVIRIIAE